MRAFMGYMAAWLSGAILSLILIVPFAYAWSKVEGPVLAMQALAFVLPFVLINAFQKLYSK